MAYNRDGHATYLMAENLEVKITERIDTGSDYSATPRSTVEGATMRGFPLNVGILPEPVICSAAWNNESK
jgi:hypothetical protein